MAHQKYKLISCKRNTAKRTGKFGWHIAIGLMLLGWIFILSGFTVLRNEDVNDTKTAAVSAFERILGFGEELTPTIRTWLAAVEKDLQSENEAFFFYFGILAPEGENVLSLGKRRFQAYKEVEDQAEHFEHPIQFDDPLKKIGSLDLSSLTDLAFPLKCSDALVETILATSNQWALELEKQSILYERYLRFLEFREFKDLTHPRSGYYSMYMPLRFGCYLRIFDALRMAEEDLGLEAIELLLEDIKKQRRLLAGTDDLILRIVLRLLIGHNLEAICHISASRQIYLNLDIPLLTQEERDLEKPMRRKFAFEYHFIKATYDRPHRTFPKSKVPAWVLRLGLNFNRTTNAAFAMCEQTVAVSKLSAREFAIADLPKQAKPHWLNITGNQLLEIKLGRFHLYLLTGLFDLNCKISMANYIASDGSTRLINPYYPEKAEEITKGNSFCLDVPFPESVDFNRCIGDRLSPVWAGWAGSLRARERSESRMPTAQPRSLNTGILGQNEAQTLAAALIAGMAKETESIALARLAKALSALSAILEADVLRQGLWMVTERMMHEMDNQKFASLASSLSNMGRKLAPGELRPVAQALLDRIQVEQQPETLQSLAAALTGVSSEHEVDLFDPFMTELLENLETESDLNALTNWGAISVGVGSRLERHRALTLAEVLGTRMETEEDSQALASLGETLSKLAFLLEPADLNPVLNALLARMYTEPDSQTLRDLGRALSGLLRTSDSDSTVEMAMDLVYGRETQDPLRTDLRNAFSGIDAKLNAPDRVILFRELVDRILSEQDTLILGRLNEALTGIAPYYLSGRTAAAKSLIERMRHETKTDNICILGKTLSGWHPWVKAAELRPAAKILMQRVRVEKKTSELYNLGSTLSKMAKFLDDDLRNFAGELLRDMQNAPGAKAMERPSAALQGICAWLDRDDQAFFAGLLIESLNTLDHCNALDRLGNTLLRMNNLRGMGLEPGVKALTQRHKIERDDAVRACLGKTLMRLNAVLNPSENPKRKRYKKKRSPG